MTDVLNIGLVRLPRSGRVFYPNVLSFFFFYFIMFTLRHVNPLFKLLDCATTIEGHGYEGLAALEGGAMVSSVTIQSVAVDEVQNGGQTRMC